MNFEKHVTNKLEHILGEKVVSAIQDPNVLEVMVNPDGQLWLDTFDGIVYYGEFSNETAKTIIFTVASMTDNEINRSNPDLSGEIPFEIKGQMVLLRFQGTIPPIVKRPAFSIRKPALRVFSLDEYVNEGVITISQKEFVCYAVKTHKNILIIGGTSSGKTTFANAVLMEITHQFPQERIITIEDTYELQCKALNKVELKVSDTRDMNGLLRDCMRLRPDRIIVGEIRGKEANTLLKACNTGHSGSLATIHANDSLSGLIRVEQLIQEGNICPIPELIAQTINVLIFIKKNKGNKGNKAGRIVDEILEVHGYDSLKRQYITTSVEVRDYDFYLGRDVMLYELLRQN